MSDRAIAGLVVIGVFILCGVADEGVKAWLARRRRGYRGRR